MKKESFGISTAVMFLIFASATIAFMGAYGTGDRQYFMGWIENAMNYGIINGFAENHDMYPPIAPLILYIAKNLFAFVPESSLFAIRISTAFFMMISCVVAWLVFRNSRICYLLFFTTILSVTNGYLDIFIVPFALLAYYMIKKKNYFLTGLFLSLMCMMKYQPLIIMPIVVAGFVGGDIKERKMHFDWNKIFKMAIGGAIPVLILLLIYRKPFLWSIYVALFRDSNYIAPNGLNLGWIIQSIYEIATGTIENHTVGIMWNLPFKALISFKYIFVFGYIVVFVRMLLQKNKTLIDVLKSSLAVYTLYYLFSTNVHENHFFVGVILALLLFAEDQDKNLNLLITSAYMFNINLLIFYGVWGGIGGFIRIICETFDPTILLAFTNVVIGVVNIVMLLRTTDTGK